MDGCKVISDMDCTNVGNQATRYGVATVNGENTYLTESTRTPAATLIDGKRWSHACRDERLAPIRLR